MSDDPGEVTDPRPLFAVVFEMQKAQIEAWCWGECGHGVCGAIDLGPCTAVPCNLEECPHLDREMTEPMGTVQGRAVYLRKLQEVTP
jgi:hypothetical protein